MEQMYDYDNYDFSDEGEDEGEEHMMGTISDLISLNDLVQKTHQYLMQRLQSFTTEMWNDEALLRTEAEQAITACLPRTARQINFACIGLPSLLEQEPAQIMEYIQAWVQEEGIALTPVLLIQANIRTFLMTTCWHLIQHASPKDDTR